MVVDVDFVCWDVDANPAGTTAEICDDRFVTTDVHTANHEL
jgi:hypothetical protein